MFFVSDPLMDGMSDGLVIETLMQIVTSLFDDIFTMET
jgi:hypothetical protein